MLDLLFTTFAALVILAGYGVIMWVDSRNRVPLGGERQRHGRSTPGSLTLPHPNRTDLKEFFGGRLE